MYQEELDISINYKSSNNLRALWSGHPLTSLLGKNDTYR